MSRGAAILARAVCRYRGHRVHAVCVAVFDGREPMAAGWCERCQESVRLPAPLDGASIKSITYDESSDLVLDHGIGRAYRRPRS